MAFFIPAVGKRSLFSTSSKTLIHGLQRHRPNPPIQFQNPNPALFIQSSPYASKIITKSPFEANLLRILRNEIECEFEYAPPYQPVTKFNSFTVQDRPGEQWITIRGKFGENENIKMEINMFDGYQSVPNPDDSSEEDLRLHISLLVGISKGEHGDELGFVCSAWPDCLEIKNVYMVRRDKTLTKPYMGPDFRGLNGELQKTLHGFLEARGINDELSLFLHEYMMNKDRTELIRWLGKVKSFVEK